MQSILRKDHFTPPSRRHQPVPAIGIARFFVEGGTGMEHSSATRWTQWAPIPSTKAFSVVIGTRSAFSMASTSARLFSAQHVAALRRPGTAEENVPDVMGRFLRTSRSGSSDPVTTCIPMRRFSMFHSSSPRACRVELDSPPRTFVTMGRTTARVAACSTIITTQIARFLSR